MSRGARFCGSRALSVRLAEQLGEVAGVAACVCYIGGGGLPGPVALGGAGHVHAGCVVEAEDVLERGDADGCGARDDVLHEVGGGLRGLVAPVALLAKAQKRLVVVRAGVGDFGVFGVVCLARVIVGELHDVHSQETAGSAKRAEPRKKVKDPNTVRAEARLKEIYGTKAVIDRRGDKGIIRFDFYSTEELNRLLDMLISED